jgi:hypothetical protein
MTATTEILDLVRRWAAAEQQNDPELLNGFLADDFHGVGPVGFVLTREQPARHPRDRPGRSAARRPHGHRVRGGVAGMRVSIGVTNYSWPRPHAWLAFRPRRRPPSCFGA